METFRHEPIDLGGPAFRLLRLLKGQGAAICCEIFQAWLPESREGLTYDALSYVWGSTDDECTIVVNGKSFKTTKNLFEALRYLQSPDQDRILWVDAICIDQTNLQERGHQVQHMSDIYKSADRVIYWLGRPTDLTTLCLKSLRRLQEVIISEGISCSTWVRTDRRWLELWAKLDVSSKTPALQRAGLGELLDRPWFRRVWILQEVANSKSAEIQCGKACVSARIFALAPYLMDVRLENHCQSVLDIMPGLSGHDCWWNQNRDLYTLFNKFSGCEASEPRDLIYALLGMASDTPDIRPAYDISEQEVVRKSIQALFFFDASCRTSLDLKNISALHDQWVNLNNVALEIAAEDQDKGDTTTYLILQRRSQFVSISATILRAAARNHVRGRGILEQLFQFIAERPKQGQSVVAISNLIEAAAEIEVGGDDTLDYLLSYNGHQLALTEASLEAAARNPASGERYLNLMIHHRKDLEITDRIVCAAAQNRLYGERIIKLLLQHGYSPMNGIPGEVLEAALRNRCTGKEVLSALLSNGRMGNDKFKEVELVFDWIEHHHDDKPRHEAHSIPLAAAQDGRTDILSLLLGWIHKADLNRRPVQQVLAWACRTGEVSSIKILLSKGVKHSLTDGSGQFPLGWAAKFGHEAAVKLLLEKGADVDIRDTYHRTSLSWAAQHGYEALAKLLVGNGADINSRDALGQTPLSHAAETGHEAVTKLLLHKGADINSKNSLDDTPLSLASHKGHEAIVKLLLEKGADIESKDYRRKTPLSLAAQNGHEAIVKLLLEKGADLNWADWYSQTPLSLAIEHGHKAIERLLRLEARKRAKSQRESKAGRGPF